MVQALNVAGYGVRIHPDAGEFRRFITAADGHDPATPLDPCFSDLPRGVFFWVQILGADGKVVACCAARVIDAPRWRGGLRRLLADQSLFCRPGEALLAPEVAVPEVSLYGRLGYIGGGWVHPGHRRRGLIGFAVQLAQTHLLKRHRIAHVIGFVREKHLDLALAPDGYAFAAAVQAPMAYCAGTGFPEKLYLVHLSAERLRQRTNGVPYCQLKSAQHFEAAAQSA